MKMSERNEAGVEYAEILADISAGKNYLEHYQTVSNKIDALNRSIDRKKECDEDCRWIVCVCYHYYRLHDIIKAAIKNN
jgi:hypothetical protein